MFNAIFSYLNVGSADWTVRRRMIIITMFFCMGVIIWSAQWVPEDGRAQSLMTSAFTLLGVIMTGYMFVAAYDDKNKRDAAVQAAPAEVIDQSLLANPDPPPFRHRKGMPLEPTPTIPSIPVTRGD